MPTTWAIPGDFATIQAAMADGSVLDGDTLNWSDHTAEDGSLLLNITKEITLNYTAAWRSGYAAVGGLDKSPTVSLASLRVTLLRIDVDNVTVNNAIVRHDRFPNARGGLIEIGPASATANVTIRNAEALTWGHQLGGRQAHPFAISINSATNFKLIGCRLFDHQFTAFGSTAEIGASIEVESSSTGLILNCSVLNLSRNAIGSFAEEGAIRLDTSADVTVINTFAHAKPRTGGAVSYSDFHTSGGASFNASSSNNAATDGSQPGTSGQTLTHHANVDFYCLGAGDGRPIAGGLADGAGAANAELVGFSDIDGNPWPTTPHIGAWATTVSIPSIPTAPITADAMDSRTPDRTVMIGNDWGYKTIGEALDCYQYHFDVSVTGPGPNVNHCAELELKTAGEAVLFLIDGDGGTPRTQDRAMFPTRETDQTNNQKIWIQQIGTKTFKENNPAVNGIWFWQQSTGNSPTGKCDIDIAGCTFKDCKPDYDNALLTPDLNGPWHISTRCVSWRINGTSLSYLRFRNNRVLNFQQEPTTGVNSGSPFAYSRAQTSQTNLVVELNYIEMAAITADLVIVGDSGLSFRKTGSDLTDGIVRNNTVVGKGLSGDATGDLYGYYENSDGTRRIDLHNNVGYTISGTYTEIFRAGSGSTFDLANASSDTSSSTGTDFIQNLAGSAFVNDADFEAGGGDFHPVIGSVLEGAGDIGEGSTVDIDGNPWINGVNIGALNSIGVIPAISAPPSDSETILVPYTLTEADSRVGDITAQFSTDGGRTFQTATQGSGGDGITSLSSSPGGTSHDFAWDSIADGIGLTSSTNVVFRIESDTFQDDEVTISVDNTLPVFDPVSPQTATVGVPFTLTVSATSPVGGFPTFTAVTIPSWSTFVDNGDGTGTLSGTPTGPSTGLESVQIQADN